MSTFAQTTKLPKRSRLRCLLSTDSTQYDHASSHRTIVSLSICKRIGRASTHRPISNPASQNLRDMTLFASSPGCQRTSEARETPSRHPPGALSRNSISSRFATWAYSAVSSAGVIPDTHPLSHITSSLTLRMLRSLHALRCSHWSLAPGHVPRVQDRVSSTRGVMIREGWRGEGCGARQALWRSYTMGGSFVGRGEYS